MTDDIFCGIGKVPKNKKLGTMKQCAEKGQIRYYGVNKVDSKLLASIQDAKKSKGPSREKLAVELIKLRGRVKNLTSKASLEKDPIKKAQFASDLAKAKTDFARVAQLFAAIESGKSHVVSPKPKKVKVDVKPKRIPKVKSQIPNVDLSLYDKEAEDLYNRSEIQKDQLRKLNKDMAKLNKAPLKTKAEHPFTKTLNDLKTAIKEIGAEVKHIQKLSNYANVDKDDVVDVTYKLNKFEKKYLQLEDKVEKLPDSKQKTKLLDDIDKLDDKARDFEIILDMIRDQNDWDDDDY